MKRRGPPNPIPPKIAVNGVDTDYLIRYLLRITVSPRIRKLCKEALGDKNPSKWVGKGRGIHFTS